MNDTNRFMSFVGASAIVAFLVHVSSLYGLGQSYHQYLWANYQQFKGDIPYAGKWYEKLFSGSHGNSTTRCMKGYIHYLNSSGQLAQILHLIPKLEGQFEKDPDIQLIFILALKQTGRVAEADERAIRMSQEFKQDQALLVQAVEGLVRRKELQNAISKVDAFLDSMPQRPNFFVFYFLKAQIYQQLQQFDKAYENVKAALELYPHFPQGWLMYALLEEQAGKYEQALSGYTSFLEVTGQSNPQIEMHIAQLAAKIQGGSPRVSAPAQSRMPARALIRGMPIQVQRGPEGLYHNAQQLFSEKKYEPALQMIDRYLTQRPQDTEGRVLKVHILLGMNQVQATIGLLSNWAVSAPGTELWLKLLHLLVRVGAPVERISRALQEIRTHYQHDAHKQMVDLYRADLALRSGDEAAALKQLEQLSTQIADASIKTKLLFQKGLLHYMQGEYTQARAALEQGDALDGYFPPLVNLLAYVYAKTVPEKRVAALRMIDQLLARYPGNHHFIDTKAFILYKQKQFDAAYALLKPLSGTHDSTILLHLAKTERKKQQQAEAHATFILAEQAAHTSFEKRAIEKVAKKWKLQST